MDLENFSLILFMFDSHKNVFFTKKKKEVRKE